MKDHLLLLSRALCLVFLQSLPALGQPVVFNEIMYHPPSTNLLQQWVEIYNPGPNAADLTGWKLSGDVDFSFASSTVLSAGAYLVIAADRPTFISLHPTIANVVGGWAGILNNSIRLDDNLGQTISNVKFSSEGDWAVRVMSAPDAWTRQGWDWLAEHDGAGKTLELLTPNLPVTNGQNWASSAVTGGTPGRVNSTAQANIAPLIMEVTHLPIIPQPSDVVTVSARILDEHTNGLSVTLNYRVDGVANFTPALMFDDGAHGDGLPGDGIYAAILPAQANHTIIEFYLQAQDLEGHVRIYPKFVPPGGSTRTANLLYQVDNGVYSGDQPIYRVIMTEQERAYLQNLSDTAATTDSDANMNGTWISVDGVVDGGLTTQVRYQVGVRNRGHGSRTAIPHNYHVNMVGDAPWKGQKGINLNSQYAYNQMLGSAIFRRLEMPMADSRAVQLRVNGTNLPAVLGGNSLGSYAANSQYDSSFVKKAFTLDPNGNSYRGIRNVDSHTTGVADFGWNGANPMIAAYTNAYFKQNNEVQNDWSDLISLIGVLNVIPGYSSAATYVADVQRVINVDEWMRYMAANTLLDNQETCLANGVGDDYALYRGAIDTRFLALSYDMDTIMGQGSGGVGPFSTSDSLFRMFALPTMDRFMKTPEFAPVYFKNLKNLAETTFSPAQMNVLLDQLLNTYLPPATLSAMKTFNAARASYVLSQIPLSLSVTSSLSVVSGYPRTTSATTTLVGLGNAIDTRTILVNGSTSSWTAWKAAWTNTSVALVPGINRILIQALNTNGVEFARTNIDIWYDTGSSAAVSGTLAANASWTPAGGPYTVTGNLIIPNGVTLTIAAGTTVFVASGATITVNGTGRILANGTDLKRVHIGKNPASGNWGSLDFINTTVESRLAWVDFDSGGGTTIGGHNAQMHVNHGIVFIDHCTWPPTPVTEYISFDASSFIVQNCFFPSYPPPTGPESLHGINGIAAGGYGIFRDNYFGHTWGFNDTIDFTGGNRPGPILQIINNVFDGASDDCLDLDSTDAWIEGNIFMHVHRDPTRTDQAIDTGSAISGGVDTLGENSDWTILNNLFYDVDHVFLNKGNSTTTGNGGGRIAFLYNTVIHVAKEYSGSTLAEIAAFDWSDDNIVAPDASIGSGMYAAYNIIYDCSVLHRLYDPAHHTVIMDNNILSVPWTGPGSGNQVVDPRLNLSSLNGIAPTNVTVAQLRVAAQLLPGSPAIRAGFGGLNLGGLQPHGIGISGEPVGTTTSTSATLTLNPGGTFNWGTTTPQPWGWTAYKWKLDNGPWSAEIPVANNSPFTNPATINLTGLANGSHTVFVSGKNDAGYYQDDTFVYPATAGIPARVTASRTWTVGAPPSRLILNEILAKNNTSLTNSGTTPDLVELWNDSPSATDLSGMGLTDDSLSHYKYLFPPGTTVPAGGYLVLYADSSVALPGLHLGFTLNLSGGGVFLYASTNGGGTMQDSVSFGIQLPDVSLGRLADGSWGLCQPTFGAANIPQPMGVQRTLKINEWLADAQFVANNDFIELYNPDPLPVPLGGLYLSDASGAPGLNRIPPLSFIAGNGFTAFTADGDTAQGADHVNFKLSPDVGMIVLSGADLSLLDVVNYGPQRTDISVGRYPDGGNTLSAFAQPTPGGPNPSPNGGITAITNITTVSTPLLTISGSTWKYDNSGTDYTTTWRAPGFNDSSWPSGRGLFGFETTPNEYLPYTFQTFIPPPPTNGGHLTVYYRTHFQWNNNLTNSSLIATSYIDDGAVFYLNNSEVARPRITANPVLYGTLAASATEPVLDILTFPTTSLVVGDNVLAVEVHQSAANSSDDVFGMSLSAVSSITNVIVNSGNISVVLNEILARNQSVTNVDGSLSDWVEIFNPATNSVDLSGISLSDDATLPRKWVVPTNVTMAAGGRLLVYLDSNVPASTNNGPLLNAGFGLKGTGEALFLFHRPASGGGLLDAVYLGLQTPNFSVGRVPNGAGAWVLNTPTPGALNVAAGLGSVANLKINEWMADPSSGSDWLELYNSGNQPVALNGLFLTDNLSDRHQSPIPPLSFIGSGNNGFVQFFADGNVGISADHVSFSLKKSGESLGIFSASGVMINGINFGAQTTDVSQGRFPDGSTNLVSFVSTPSPGERNYLPLTSVVINEAISHTTEPLEDAIELFNPTTASVDASGWFLSDSKSDYFRFRIPNNTVIQPGGFAVLYEYQFNPVPGVTPSFALSSAHGENLFLSATDVQGNFLGFRTDEKFGAADDGVSFGRYFTSQGVDFVAMSQRTFGRDNPATVQDFRGGGGLSNAYPKVGPVVINEIMYHPPPIGTNDDVADEFIELKNITGGPVALFDTNYPTNTWRLRHAVDFDFPTNITLPAGGFVLVVSFDPVADPVALASLQSKYGLSPAVRIFGPYLGKLNNGGETIELHKPGAPQPAGLPDAGFVPSILVEQVKYSDVAPWATAADGNTNGLLISLQRRLGAEYGNDPVNWLAGTATPGAESGPAIVAAPSIVTLTAPQLVAPGANVTLTVSAVGNAPLGFQWRYNGVLIPGATNTTLAVGNLQDANAGSYRAVVSNPGGTASAETRIDLALRPSITKDPQNTVAAGGGMALFTVGVRGTTPLSFQWQKNGGILGGATNANLILSNIQAADEANYRVVVTNLYGSTTSSVASLSLSAAPAIASPPQSTNAFVGASVTLSVGAVGGQPLSYQWFFNNNLIPKATNASLILNNVQLTNSGNYNVRVTNLLGSVTTPAANLTVIVAPTVTILASDPSAAEAGLDAGAFTINRSGNASFPLTVSFTVGGSAIADSDYMALVSPITIPPGASSATLSVTPLDDSIPEPIETVIVTLSSSSDYVLGSPNTATVTILDDDNVAPSVTITNPASGATFTGPVNIALGAVATDSDGSVARVDFYSDTTNKLGTATTAPYGITWTNAVAGTHLLTAVATDNFGATGISAPVSIYINSPPTVSITTPGNGASFVAPANIVITASATDNGSVSLVEFFVDSTPLGSRTSSPYTITWTNVGIGDYVLSARATDNQGAIGFSTPVNLSVHEPTLNFADNFSERGLLRGFTNFVFGDNSNYSREAGEPAHDAKYGTNSAWISWIAPDSGTCTMTTTTNGLTGLSNLFDTVLAVYTGNVVSNLAFIASDDDDPTATGYTAQSLVSFSAVAGATYQVAVDAYGAGQGGNIYFRLSLPNSFPVITNQPQSQVVNPGLNVTFNVGARSPTPLLYQWLFNGTNLDNATNSALVLNGVGGPNSGAYSVRLGNAAHSITSAPAILTVRTAPFITQPPQPLIVDPGSNAVFSVSVTGETPFTYQWQFNSANISGATSNPFTLIGAQHTNGGNYSVVIGNSLGAAFSQSAELIVRPRIVGGTVLSNGSFRLTLNGTPGKQYIIESAINMPNWVPLEGINPSAVQMQYIDTSAPASSNRMYRLRLGP